MSRHLALVACLDETRSVHSLTFKRAVALFQAYAVAHAAPALPITCYDDGADAATAARVARRIVADAPCAVVGHFASSAAAAAAPVYAAAGLPLLLPAATARCLTGHTSTWRVCGHDEMYVAALQDFCAVQGLYIGHVEHDGSVHGASIAAALQKRQGSGTPPRRAATVFSGSCSSAIDFLARHRAADGPVILTDDALAGQIVAPALTHRGEVFVAGLAPAFQGAMAHWLDRECRGRFSAAPGTYFWETVAAIEVASASAGRDLGGRGWPTVLGTVQFDAEREAGLAGFTAYRVAPHGLEEIAQ
jgi:hypothetical protein